MLYTAAAQLPLGPLIPTACIVSATLGDRRLRSHVLAGLELLMPLLIDDARLNAALLLRAVPAGRPMSEESEGRLPEPTCDFVVDHCIASRGAQWWSWGLVSMFDALCCCRH